MGRIEIEAPGGLPVHRQRIEVVERKGKGHPDSICDAIADAVSRRLCREYVARAGRVLHHNVDKSLLIAGISEPALGGGRIVAPMRFVLGGRATGEWGAERLALAELAEEEARGWMRRHLRYVDPERHLVFESALRPGSAQLTDLFERQRPGANDTSVGVGHAPLSETERLVLAAERRVNSAELEALHPEAGEDVKVMAVRRERELELTVAVAFVDRFVASARDYFERKEELRRELEWHLTANLEQLDALHVRLNALDDPERGTAGMYLTVLGTSADGADGGQVGRGNRVNGLITFGRPASLEAACGKNPVRHVGKIYNHLAGRVAERVYAEVEGLEEVQVLLCSRIGQPVDDPWISSLQLALAPGVELAAVEEPVRATVARELAHTLEFVESLWRGAGEGP